MVRLRVVPGQIDVNDPSRRNVAFGTLFFLPWNHWSALAKLRGTSAIKPYLTLPCEKNQCYRLNVLAII